MRGHDRHLAGRDMAAGQGILLQAAAGKEEFMKTLVIKESDPDFAQEMEQAAQVIKDGGLVAFPTETVYGLGGNALDAEASAKIYAAKGRPSDNPLIVHICDPEDLDKVAVADDPRVRKLADAFWPGPLTMILDKKEIVPKETTGGLDTVAVRCPNHPLALELIRRSTGFIAAPSANTSGRPSPTKAEHVEEDLSGKIDCIIDGGEVGIGLESTILDMSEEIPTILRPGYITPQMLEKVIGKVRMDPALMTAGKGQRPKAPGMKYRHYAPKAQMYLVKGDKDAVVRKIQDLCQKEKEAGRKVGILCSDETKGCYPYGTVVALGSRDHEEEIARNLFDALRSFDHMDTDVIYSEWFEAPGIGIAVMNRMMKAAGHQVIAAE